jgi:D-alanyl-D-alanine carboxypeptidase (penicillin-binding protein 5/6)
LCWFAFFFCPASSSGAFAGAFEVDAGAAVLMDMGTKRLLYEQNSERRIPPASLTKVMSMFVALDEIRAGRLSLQAMVRVSKRAARTGGSSMRLRAGETVRLDDLLRGMAVASANDAAVAVAEHAAGSQEAFVAMMNRKAARLGMKKTRFRTPHGLPAKGQLTTAADMLRLAWRYLETHPSARHYHSTPFILHNGILISNTNKLLGDEVSGLKTGFTRASGYNIILTSTRHGREMVAVLMKTSSAEVRAREAQRLLEYGEGVRERLNGLSAKKTRKAAAVAAESRMRRQADAAGSGKGFAARERLVFAGEAGKERFAFRNRRTARDGGMVHCNT